MRNLFNVKIPSDVSRGEEVKASDHNKILEALRMIYREVRSLAPQNSADISIARTPDGFATRVKRRTPGIGGDESGPCPFGEIITYQVDDETKTGLRGGLFQCGDQNFSVPNQEIDLGTNGKWFIQLKLSGVKPNVDDDEEIFLPGIETATGTPAWDFKTWTDGGNYDDTTNPTSPGSTGELVIPGGILTITDGNYTYDRVGCGNILATQCAGILNHSRV